MKVTLLIPIDKYSFFVNAKLQNIYETCPLSSYLDIVFLTPKTTNLTEAFKEASKKYKFRVISAPFEEKNKHVKLIDWAMREGDLKDWVILQHADLFLSENTWLDKILNTIHENPKMFALRDGNRDLQGANSKFKLDGNNVHCFHDYFIVYNRKLVVEHDLTVDWGPVKRIPFSDITRKAIKEGRLTWFKSDKQGQGSKKKTHLIKGHDGLDGSEAMTLEVAMLFPQDAVKVQWFRYKHFWQVFRMTNRCHIKNNHWTTHWGSVDISPGAAIPNEWKQHFYVQHSAFTSFLLDLDEVKNCVLPWRLTKRLFKHRGEEWLADQKNKVCILEKYLLPSAKVLGENDTFGIDFLKFGDETYPMGVSLL